MKTFKQYFVEDTFTEATKVVDDGSVLNVHHNDKHIGNIMKSSSDKKTPFRAYSKHWDMKRLHPTKKAAVDWLVQTHKTAINEEGAVAINAVGAGNIQGIGFGPKGEPGGRKAIMNKMLKRKPPNVVAKVSS